MLSSEAPRIKTDPDYTTDELMQIILDGTDNDDAPIALMHLMSRHRLLAAERDEWKRIAEWLAEHVERVPFEFSGNLAEYRSRMTAARIQAAREAVKESGAS